MKNINNLSGAILILFACLTSGCTSSQQTTEEFYPSWEATKIRVASLSAVTNFLRFHRSVMFFQNPSIASRALPLELIEGDAIYVIRSTSTVHITGDLLADIYLAGNSELVIGGEVADGATIHVDGLSSIYVAGSFYGNIEATNSYHLYVDGSFYGNMEMSGSSIKIAVLGDFFGSLKTANESRLNSALINVDGYIDSDLIKQIYSQRFVTLTGVFRFSNVAPGIYWEGMSALKYYTVLQRVKPQKPPSPKSNKADRFI